jgi:hypothetical protein
MEARSAIRAGALVLAIAAGKLLVHLCAGLHYGYFVKFLANISSQFNVQ